MLFQASRYLKSQNGGAAAFLLELQCFPMIPSARQALNTSDRRTCTECVLLDANGALFWSEQPVQMDGLAARFQSVAGDKPHPEIRIRADVNTRYEMLAQVMATAPRSGMQRIGFVTSPRAAAPPQVGGEATSAGATTMP